MMPVKAVRNLEKLSVSHSCGDSGLKCVDCNEQVCPRCMVQCAVGNRCKKCAGRFTSHILKTSPKILVRLGLAMVALGFAYGYLAPWLAYIPFGIYGYAIDFFLFFSIAKFMHRIAAFKLGPKVAVTAFLSLLAGVMLGPARETLLSLCAVGAAGPAGAEAYEMGGNLTLLVLFFATILWPFLRRN
jgi:hypothetical protein